MKAIIFRGDMVLAILAGKKTQTRRGHSKPMHVVGDVVYVKESWRTNEDPLDNGTNLESVWYRADALEYEQKTEPWKTPLLMPEWASRIKLRITATRRETLKSMTEANALAEGVTGSETKTPLEAFADLWDDIKGPLAWESNPTVCVYEFERES